MSGWTLPAALAAAVTVGLGAAWALDLLPARLGRARSHRRPPGSLRLWLIRCGTRTTPTRFLVLSAGTALLAGLGVAGLTGTVMLGVVGGLVAGGAPALWLRRRRDRRAAAVVASWPDALRAVVAALESGASLHQALVQLGTGGPEPLRPSFLRYATVAPAASSAVALRALREELGDPVTDRVVEVLLLAMLQGPAIVIGVMRDLAAATSADLALDERIRTAQLEQQLNGWAVLIIPYALLALLCARVEPFAAFYRRPVGYVVIGIGLVLSGAGMAALSRLARLRTEPRVFTGDPR